MNKETSTVLSITAILGLITAVLCLANALLNFLAI